MSAQLSMVETVGFILSILPPLPQALSDAKARQFGV